MSRVAIGVVVLLGLIAIAAAPLAARDARVQLLVIAHPSVRANAAPASALRGLFLRQTDLLQGQRVHPLNYPPGDPVRVSFDQWILRMSASEVGRFWVDTRMRGAGAPPRTLPPHLLVRVVAAFPGAVSYATPEMLQGAQVKILRVEEP